MANYTISTTTFNFAYSNFHDSSPLSGTQEVTITPNAGYVVSASTFTSGNSIVTDNTFISAVSFSDTGTANMPDNTVTVTLTMTGVPTSDTTISLSSSITADATIYDNTIPHEYYIKFDNSNLTGLTTTFNANTSAGFSKIVNILGGTTFFDKDNITPIKIGDITITPSDTSNDVIDTSGFGFQFGNLISFATEVQPSKSPVTFEVTSATYGTDDDKFKNYLKTITADIYVKPFFDLKNFNGTNKPGSKELENQFRLKLKGKAFEVPADTKSIIAVNLDSNIIARRGQTKIITVVGDIGASFKYTVRQTDAFHDRVYAKLAGTTTEINELTATIQPTSKVTKGQSTFTFIAEFDSVSTTTKYDLIIDADTGTIGLDGVDGGSQTTLLYQYTNPRVMFVVNGFTTGTNITERINIAKSALVPSIARSVSSTDYIITGRPLAEGGSLSHIRDTGTFKVVFEFVGDGTPVTVNSDAINFTESTSNITGDANENKTKLEISNITRGGNGTLIGTLSFNVNIERWGTDGDTIFTSNDLSSIFVT
jgi:hypothetical protein